MRRLTFSGNGNMSQTNAGCEIHDGLRVQLRQNRVKKKKLAAQLKSTSVGGAFRALPLDSSTLRCCRSLTLLHESSTRVEVTSVIAAVQDGTLLLRISPRDTLPHGFCKVVKHGSTKWYNYIYLSSTCEPESQRQTPQRVNPPPQIELPRKLTE